MPERSGPIGESTGLVPPWQVRQRRSKIWRPDSTGSTAEAAAITPARASATHASLEEYLMPAMVGPALHRVVSETSPFGLRFRDGAARAGLRPMPTRETTA